MVLTGPIAAGAMEIEFKAEADQRHGLERPARHLAAQIDVDPMRLAPPRRWRG